MNKQAILEGMSPAQTLLAAMLMGGGGFGGLKLLQDGYNTLNPEKKKDNSLQLDIPTQGMAPKQANDIPANPDENLYRWIAMLGGAPLGFLGMKGIYDGYKDEQGNKNIEAEKQKYLQTLSGFKHASETPTLDGFIDNFITHMEKSANDGGMNLASLAGQNPEMYQQAEKDVLQNGLLGNASSYMTGGLSDSAKNAMGALALLSAVMTGGAFMLADKNKAQSASSRQFPDKVKLNPITLPPSQPKPQMPGQHPGHQM